MKTIGLVGAGHMGSGLGWALRAGGHDVITSIAGRSPRTAKLAAQAGLRIVPGVADVMAQADIVLVVTPPAVAPAAATAIAAAAGPETRPLIVDLNATAPATAEEIGAILAGAGLDFVDGSISGPPPTVQPGATVYLSGPRAVEVAALNWTHARAVVVGDAIGAASAVKMSTASVYKGLMGLLTQAMRSASSHGVLATVMADLGDSYGSAYGVAVSATKADRYVGEMHEIARTQAGAGLTPHLFEAFAEVWADIATTPLAGDDPESVDRGISVDDVANLLRQPGRVAS